jgi:PST family polysaccharide transporter
MVPLLTSIGFIVAGIWSLYLVKRDFGVMFKLQTIETLKYHLLEGWHVFIAGLFTLVYTISIPFILGIFTNNTVLGYFSIAEKIIKAINSVYGPLNQAVFPFVNNMISKSKIKAKSFLLKLLIFSSIMMFIISILVFIYSSKIILLISGKNIIQAVLVLKILSILPFIITIARILSFNYIIGFGYKEVLSKIYFYSAIISLTMIFILIPLYAEVGASITIVVTELFATCYMFVLIHKKIRFFNE